MQLSDLYNYLISNGATNFEKVLGITIDEFNVLYQVFIFTRSSDKTRKLNNQEKLIALILIKRFSLSDDEIKNIIFSGNVTKAVLDTFKRSVQPRLDNALSGLPLLANKLNPAFSPVYSLLGIKHVFSNLDELLYAINLTTQSNVIVTAKARTVSPEWLSNYLVKPVTSKKKTGQEGFLQMLNALRYDVGAIQRADSYQMMYISSVLNIYIHNSSYSPPTGYGKAQQREVDHPIKYSRSQSGHVNNRFFKQLTAFNQKKQCLQPKNEVVFKLYCYTVTSSFINDLLKYDANGYLKVGQDAKRLSYFSSQYAHSGLRRNSYNISITGISFYLNTHSPSNLFEHIKKEFSAHGNTRKPIYRFSQGIIQSRISYIKYLVAWLEEKANLKYYPGLYDSLTKYRHASAKQVYEHFQKNKMKNIDVYYDAETNCLDIRFYPNQKIEDSANYKDGVTNVIINYFIGLLNHKSHVANLFVRAVRRQSFAFNRITICDTTNMCMRVSFGYEPSSFLPIFIASLNKLSELIDENCYNFMDRKNPYLAGGFKIVENPKGKNVTEKTGTQFLKFSRSPKKMLKSIDRVEEYLMLSNGSEHYESRAFLNYINFIANDVNNIVHTPTPIPKAINTESVASSSDNILVTGLLNNLLKYTIEKINQSYLLFNEQLYLNSYHHVLSKLVKYCYKVHALLDQHTKLPLSHVYAKSLLLVEDILENLVVLDSLLIASQRDGFDYSAPSNVLRQTEKMYARNSFSIEPDKIDVFFADNGQQALGVILLCMEMQLFERKEANGLSASVYVFEKCYFELFPSLRENMGVTLRASPDEAEFIFIDIREVHQINCQQNTLSKAKVIVIDCTHNPCFQKGDLSNIVNALLAQSKWVIIVSSMLKHEQLGMDKFQAGKILVFSPKNMQLSPHVRDEFESITQDSMHPIAASYFQMINEICRDKPKVGDSLLTMNKTGFFSAQASSNSSPEMPHKGFLNQKF